MVELCAVVALGYWGWHSGRSVGRLVLVIAAPMALAHVWGVWVAPASSRRLWDPLRFGVEVVVFCGAGVALIVAGQILLGVVLGALGIAVAASLRLLDHPAAERNAADG